MKEQVVITGIGCITPIGNNIEEFAKSLKEGVSGAGRITHFNASQHKVQIACEVKNFNLADYIGLEESRKFRKCDLSSQYALAATQQALKDSNLPDNYENISVVIGTGIGGVLALESQTEVLLKKCPDRVSPFLVPQLMPNAIVSNISLLYALHGRTRTINTACSSSNDAIIDAYLNISSRLEDIVITGGAEFATIATAIAGFGNMNALTKNYNDAPQKASRPFDRDRSGFVISEGAGILVLESLTHAKKRNGKIYAEVLGFGATTDAYHITKPEEDAKQISRAIKQAIERSNLSPEKIDYINAHGTSTPLNDKTETLAIKKVFGDYSYHIPISSTKSMHGHALGAAGSLELIATLLAMQHSFIPPTINYENLDPECDLDYVPNVAREQEINIAMSNAFGFGGHNSVLVFRKWQ